MKKKKNLKWWIAAVSAVFIVGAGIFVYTQYKAAQTSGDVATKDGTSASASDITWNGKTYSYNEHLSNFLFLGIDTKEKAETKSRFLYIRRRSTNKAESSIRKVWGFFLYWETRHFWKGPGLSCLQTVQKFLSDQETAGMAM